MKLFFTLSFVLFLFLPCTFTLCLTDLQVVQWNKEPLLITRYFYTGY